MANLYEIHYYEPADLSAERKGFVVAVSESNARAYLQDVEGAGTIAPGWTIFDLGEVQGTPEAFPVGPTQLTKAADGRWDES